MRMAIWFSTFFISIFFVFSAFAAEKCDLRSESLTDLVKISCEETKTSKQCQKVYQEINEAGGTASDRSLICNGDQNQSWLSSSADWATGCMIGVGDYFINIGKSIGETAAQIIQNREEKKSRACGL